MYSNWDVHLVCAGTWATTRLPDNVCASLPQGADIDIQDHPLVCCPSSIADGCSGLPCTPKVRDLFCWVNSIQALLLGNKLAFHCKLIVILKSCLPCIMLTPLHVSKPLRYTAAFGFQLHFWSVSRIANQAHMELCKRPRASSAQRGRPPQQVQQLSAGKYASSPSRSVCAPCPAGSQASITGMTSCTLCSPGTSAPSTRTTSCSKYSAGTYSPGAGKHTPA